MARRRCATTGPYEVSRSRMRYRGAWFHGKASAVRAIVKTQNALKTNVARAVEVGRKLFPSMEAELIVELIRRDLPYYEASISESFVAGMNQFAGDLGIVTGHVLYEKVVATQFRQLWNA